MSEGEIVVMVASIVAAGFLAARWFMRPLMLTSYGAMSTTRWLLPVVFPVAVLGVFVGLRTTASYDVRDAPEYLTMYTVLGAAWMLAAVSALEFFGVSYSHDAMERANPAAGLVIASAMIANALIYAGANIGDGPGWWCVIAAGGLGAATWFLAWFCIERASEASERITVDRDLSAAARLGALMVAIGLICARGSAGDWTSLWQTIMEFRVAWPVIPLAAAAIWVEKSFARNAMTHGPASRLALSALLAVAYLAIAGFAVEQSLPLPQNPMYDSIEQR